jgi:hypothetical protein
MHSKPPSLLLLAAALAAAAVVAPAAAQTAAPAKAAAPAKVAKAPPKAVKKAEPVEAPLIPAGPDQIKAAEMVYYGKYECEFNQSVDITQDPKNLGYVDVKHGKTGAWLMKPVLSSTGAIRLEDVKGETLMVQISSKSMLLNVKTAKRLVDDCVSPRQRELIEEARAAKASAEASAKAASAAS